MTTAPQDTDRGTDLLAQQRAERAAAAERSARTGKLLERYGVLVPFVLVAAVATVLAPNFLSGANIRNLLVNGSVLAIVAFGMTLVIALRGLDLSVGSTQALTAVVAGTVVNSLGLVPGIIAGLLVGAAVGLLNGVLVAYLRVPAFVATLGTLGIARGAALVFTKGGSVLVDDASIGTLANGTLLGVPVPFLLAAALLVAMYLLLETTPFGRHVCAVGGSPQAAVESGINVRHVTVLSFVVVGTAAGLAGVLLTSQLSFVDGTLGVGLELQAIAVAVLGGTSLVGGGGNMVGTFLGALLLTMIAATLNLLNIASFYQYLAVGVLLLFALTLDTVRRTVQRSRLETS